MTTTPTVSEAARAMQKKGWDSKVKRLGGKKKAREHMREIAKRPRKKLST